MEVLCLLRDTLSTVGHFVYRVWPDNYRKLCIMPKFKYGRK